MLKDLKNMVRALFITCHFLSHACTNTSFQYCVTEMPLIRMSFPCFSFFWQDSTDGSEIKEHVLKHALPLVGHRKPSNDVKRYTKRPLVVVYYTVDFSFDYRVGKFTIPLLWKEASDK